MGNDLGNKVLPRDALVFEGLLGILQDPKVAAQATKFAKRGKWREAVACYDMNELLSRKIWDLVFRFDIEIDLLTYVSREFALALEDRMNNEDMPFRRVWFEEPNMLARRLATMPNLRTIYDPDPAHQFLYGGRGRIITPDQAHLLLGAM